MNRQTIPQQPKTQNTKTIDYHFIVTWIKRRRYLGSVIVKNSFCPFKKMLVQKLINRMIQSKQISSETSVAMSTIMSKASWNWCYNFFKFWFKVPKMWPCHNLPFVNICIFPGRVDILSSCLFQIERSCLTFRLFSNVIFIIISGCYECNFCSCIVQFL